MLFKDWMEEWLAKFVEPIAKEKTFKRYREVTFQHIIPKFGTRELESVSLEEYQWFVAELLSKGNLRTGKGLSPSSVNLIISILQNALKTASAFGLTPSYELNKLKRPKIKEKQIECFSKAEQKAIEKAVLQDKRPKMFGIILCLYTGLRIGELLALEWTDVNFQSGEISITKSCFDSIGKDGKYIRKTDTPKTESSVRVIPLPKQIVPLLRQVKKESRSAFVVGNGDKMISIRSYQTSFQLLLQKLGIPPRGFHSLRHTFATRANEAGMDPKTLADILGHNNPMITLKRYTHSLLDQKKLMMNAVGKFL